VAHSAEIRGRVFDAATFVGLEGATVTLDLLPADGTPEFTTGADVFGLYSITNIPAGSYRLRATQPGYEASQQDETFAADSRRARNLPLTRLPGDPSRFKIVTEVSCVKSGLRLSDVKVRVERFAGAADATPDASFLLNTDSNGRAVLYGAVDGHYVFTVNHPTTGSARARWESFVSPRKALHGHHLVLALLKPVPQTMAIRVMGFDPTLGPTGMTNQRSGTSRSNSKAWIPPIPIRCWCRCASAGRARMARRNSPTCRRLPGARRRSTSATIRRRW